MAIKRNSNQNVKKNSYKRDDTTKPKHNKIKTLLLEKRIKQYHKQKTNLDKKTIQNIKKIVLSILLSLCIFVSIIWGAYAVYNSATKADYFNLKFIEISGNQFLSKNEIIDATQLEIGKNILDYKIKNIQIVLLNNPWIENVQIKRTLPNKISIKLKEREPIFWSIKDQEMYYLDKDLNYITKVNNNKYISLPTLNIKFANENTLKTLPKVIDLLRIEEFPFELNEISWFSIDSNIGYELYIDKHNLLISFDLEKLERNIENLTSAIKDLKKRNEINKV